jgi:CxxC motif-containing protein (DUF1111 family)
MTFHVVRRRLLHYMLAALSAVGTSFSHAVAPDGVVASARLGGSATVNVSGKDAYSLPSANLSPLRRLDFSVGNSFFRNPWVIAPSSTDARDGLGPLFNTNACQNCHIKDGRGHPVSDASDNAVSMLVRLSIPATTAADHALAKQLGVVPEPTYGTQFQDMAIPGIEPEVKIRLRWTTRQVSLAGGETVALRQPRLLLSAWGYAPVHPHTQYSVRVAPPMIGLGLLEAIPLARMQQLADPADADNDGISGRLNQVWDHRQHATVAGRFGWKAGQPSLDQQNAAAFAGDMGLTSSLMEQDECSPVQTHCLSAPSGGIPEVSDEIRARVLFYSRQLAVPAQRRVTSSDVQAGGAVFQRAGCAACHVPSHQTRADAAEPELANQHIWPYTDLLLHDMGPGLADGRPEFDASGSEWRTPPLWGIGLTQTVNPRAGFLHDGRARTLLEAIVWHGGEAQASRDAVTQLSASERHALLAFLESL